jgi:hypothetical protein
MSIASLLNQIKEGEIVLPAIQRDFVWSSDKIFTLLDSIMRGYPVGSVILWETYRDIQYRKFLADHRKENVHSYYDNSTGKKIKLVVDGQQRLQSLYVALYGTFEGCPLYFDVLSGRESEDVSDDRYVFSFSTEAEIKQTRKEVEQFLSTPTEKRDKQFEITHYIKVSELFSMRAEDKERLKESLSKQLHLTEEDRIRLSINLSLLDQSLSKEGDILKETIIDKDLPSASTGRKTDQDVLEIFVRVNTQNTRLSRSDLIFSMLKLNWKESATYLPEFIRNINKGNSFEFDNDFVIRCLFAVSNIGTKFDIDLLRKSSNITKLRNNFDQCCDAIRSATDFVQRECWCASSDIIGGLSTLVPFVYYLFYTKDHLVPNNQIDRVRKSFFLIAFTKPFSRYADSRTWAVIRDDLKPLADKKDPTFPLEQFIGWVEYWQFHSFESLLQNNHELALHLIQGLSGAQVQYDRNSPEIDHIFPRAELRTKGFEPSQVNDYANFWILARTKNRNKSNQHPDEYFKDVPDAQLKAALIDREYLDYRRYTTFLGDRKQRMIQKVIQKIGYDSTEFDQK